MIITRETTSKQHPSWYLKTNPRTPKPHPKKHIYRNRSSTAGNKLIECNPEAPLHDEDIG
jgi:hypothetical protein